MSTAPLTTEMVRLVAIFRAKGWFMGMKGDSVEADARLARAMETLKLLDEPEERELFLELLQKYRLASWAEYPSLLKSALTYLAGEPAYDSAARTAYAPIKKAKDDEAYLAKSGSILPHLAKTVHGIISGLSSSASYYDSVKGISMGNEKLNVVLLDDFIGSGKTAENALENAAHLLLDDRCNVFLCVLVAHTKGVEYLESSGFDHVFAAELHACAISDDYESDALDKEQKLEVLDRLEVVHGMPNGYRRGFGRCEAVITLLRTPNNTLPMFWSTRTRAGRTWPAVFPR